MRDAFGRVQTVLVLGGASDIGLAIVRELLADGPLTAVLAARRPVDGAELERAGARVEHVEFDALAVETHERVLGGVFDRHGDVDLVVLAFGVLGDQAEAERDPAAAVAVAQTNFAGAVSALTVVASRLRAQGHGAIAVLSSIAAVRARRSNFVYGASKAGLDAYAQGLRLALAPEGIGVTVVRPGFVRTKMTAGLERMPLAVDAERVARATVAGVRAGAAVVWVPRALRLVALLLRLLPERALRRL